jgi:hypothetical protein
MQDIDIDRGQVESGYQALSSLVLLVFLLAVCVGTDLLARSRGLERWLTARSSEIAERTNKIFSYTGNFIDFEDRVLLDEIPRTDYSSGGVFFFGTSNMKWAFPTWDLPSAERRFIGNYGIGASNHSTQLQLIRYLISHRGFLSAGDRDLVVFGVSFHLGVGDAVGAGFFDALLRRHGLFTISSDRIITPARMSALERRLLVEKARSGGFMWNIGRVAKGGLELMAGRSARNSHAAARYQQAWRQYMGPDWQREMDDQVEQFKTTISLVRSHGARVKVIFLPQGTWMDGLPFKSYYESKIRSLCVATSTPLIDLSRSIPDDDFIESNHLSVKGQEKFRRLILPLIDEQLQRHAVPVTSSRTG